MDRVRGDRNSGIRVPVELGGSCRCLLFIWVMVAFETVKST